MTDSLIKYEAGDVAAQVILNRPEVLNSINREMAEQLLSALERAAADHDIRAVLLAAEGRAFCAGQDLSEAAAAEGGAAPDFAKMVRERYNPIVQVLRRMEKPVVAAVQGAAAGAGANLAIACDLAVAAEDAFFVEPFASLGLVPDTAGTYFLPRLIGLQRAAGMMMLGERISAAQAQGWGLVYRVFPPDALRREALAIAHRLAALPAAGLALTKRALDESWRHSLVSQMALEAELQGVAGNTEGSRAAIRAFLATRELKKKEEGS